MRHPFMAIVPLFFSVSLARASTLDGIAIESGHSTSSKCDLSLLRVSLQKGWKREWLKGENWHVGGYWDLSLGHWKNRSDHPTNSGIVDFGFTPVFRFERNDRSTFDPYVEAAMGFHLLSHASVSRHRQFGSAFEFGDHVGLGLTFGTDRIYDLGYRFQHLSNAGLKQPNKGINFHMVRLGVQF